MVPGKGKQYVGRDQGEQGVASGQGESQPDAGQGQTHQTASRLMTRGEQNPHRHAQEGEGAAVGMGSGAHGGGENAERGSRDPGAQGVAVLQGIEKPGQPALGAVRAAPGEVGGRGDQEQGDQAGCQRAGKTRGRGVKIGRVAVGGGEFGRVLPGAHRLAREREESQPAGGGMGVQGRPGVGGGPGSLGGEPERVIQHHGLLPGHGDHPRDKRGKSDQKREEKEQQHPPAAGRERGRAQGLPPAVRQAFA